MSDLLREQIIKKEIDRLWFETFGAYDPETQYKLVYIKNCKIVLIYGILSGSQQKEVYYAQHDLLLTIDEFSKRFLQPLVRQFAPDVSLRDLARQIEELAKNHPAYSQAHKVVQNCCDHLRAMARCEECQRAK